MAALSLIQDNITDDDIVENNLFLHRFDCFLEAFYISPDYRDGELGKWVLQNLDEILRYTLHVDVCGLAVTPHAYEYQINVEESKPGNSLYDWLIDMDLTKVEWNKLVEFILFIRFRRNLHADNDGDGKKRVNGSNEEAFMDREYYKAVSESRVRHTENFVLASGDLDGPGLE